MPSRESFLNSAVISCYRETSRSNGCVFCFDFRDCAIKFNDYFEFPRQFDMEPFTVEGLAKIEGEIVEDDRCEDKDKNEIEEEVIEKPGSTVYNLVGVVVHSGQASGGHYYSYIIPRYTP